MAKSKLMKMRRTRFDTVFDTVNVILLVIVMVIILYPLYFTVIASISDPWELMGGNVILLPKGFTLEPYTNIFRNNEIWVGYTNSLFYAGVGTIYALAVTIPTAFVMSRKIKGHNFFMAYFMFTMYFSGGLIPTYVLIRNLGMLDTRAALIIPAGMSIYNMIIVRTFYMSSIPDDLFEAAKIDGANDFRIFFQIALPLSGAIIAVIALYCAVGHWNSYMGALIYLNNSDKYPLQLILRNILLENQTLKNIEVRSMDSLQMEAMMRRSMMAESMKYALIFVSSLPVLIAYPFVQKHFVKGVMIGALKG
ncbi:MAG: carbohydrate ABC transporter permease [Christensenellales bacterium]|jgi:putative aldouronate transport system permease protein